MSVDEFIEKKVLPQYRGIVAAIRELMHQEAPEAKEQMAYGVPTFRRNKIFAVISPTKKGITLAFSMGAEFEDKYGLLEGEGKVSKNVRMKSLDEVNLEALRYYVKQALEIDTK